MTRVLRKRPTKQMIISAGTKLYLQEGFTNTTNMKICKAIDISPGQFTFHFPTKEHLLLELVRELCEYQLDVIDKHLEQEADPLLAYCLEITTIAAVCEKSSVTRDFFVSVYTHPLTLSLIRERDSKKAYKFFKEFNSEWELEDFRKMEIVASGIEYGMLAVESDQKMDLKEKIRCGVDALLKIYNVPELERDSLLKKLFELDYCSIGQNILHEFIDYVEHVNELALEQAIKNIT